MGSKATAATAATGQLAATAAVWRRRLVAACRHAARAALLRRALASRADGGRGMSPCDGSKDGCQGYVSVRVRWGVMGLQCVRSSSCKGYGNVNRGWRRKWASCWRQRRTLRATGGGKWRRRRRLVMQHGGVSSGRGRASAHKWGCKCGGTVPWLSCCQGQIMCQHGYSGAMHACSDKRMSVM